MKTQKQILPITCRDLEDSAQMLKAEILSLSFSDFTFYQINFISALLCKIIIKPLIQIQLIQ